MSAPTGSGKRRGPAARPPDDPVQQLERDRAALRIRARSVLGIEGEQGSVPPRLRETISRTNAGWYPLVALGALAIVDQFQARTLFILGPEVARAIGITAGTLAVLNALTGLAAGLATLPMAAYVQNRPRRAAVALVTGLVWSVTTIFLGFVTGLFLLALILILDGASTGSVQSVHQPLLMDSYPPEGRVRALSIYRGADALGNVLAPLSVFVLTSLLAFTWRGVFLTLGLLSVFAILVAVRLRDPGFGRWDTSRVRDLVRTERPSSGRAELEERTSLGFFEIVRRLMVIPTIRRLLTAFAVVGMMIFPLQTFFAFFLDERWGMGPGARALLVAGAWGAAVFGLLAFGSRAEALFRRDPGRLIEVTAYGLIILVVAIAISVLMPFFILMVLFYVVGFAVLPTLLPAFYAASLSIVPPNMRPHVQALSTIYLTAVGGLAGGLLLGSVYSRFGAVVAIVSLAVPGILSAIVLRSARHSIVPDLDRMIDEIVESEEIRKLSEQGRPLPLLACRGIDFSYGRLQVLFDVDLTVQDGEAVGLLGVNGAGKSTLLRVISGLGLPTKGSVRLMGTDITYLDAERRVPLGITQVPGGKAIFSSLTVVQNLRLFGVTLGREPKLVERAMERSFEAFPRLAERRNQPAGTLSGGEQQMLALSKALLLRPRLLLIDELSLGLAPVIVGQLLDMVREINRMGTSVILVEQSVNVALSLVDHVYFMEKGEIRFDGEAKDLLTRKDLLRAVFLGSGGTNTPERKKGRSRAKGASR